MNYKLGVVVLSALLLAIPASARSLQDVKQSGVLDIYIYADYPPYSFKDGEDLKGIDMDVGEALAAFLGVKASFLVRDAGDSVDDDLRIEIIRGDIIQHKVADVMMRVPIDPVLAAHNEDAVICCTWFSEELAVLYKTERLVGLDSFERFIDTPIAVERDTISDHILSTIHDGQVRASIVHGRRFEDAERSFLSGEADGMMALRAQLEWVASHASQPTAIVSLPLPGMFRNSWPIGLAVRKGNEDLAAAFETALIELKRSGRLAEICAKYKTTCGVKNGK